MGDFMKKEKIWTTQEARIDYENNKAKGCGKCKHSNTYCYLSCGVKSVTKRINFPRLKAMNCKYYTEKRY